MSKFKNAILDDSKEVVRGKNSARHGKREINYMKMKRTMPYRRRAGQSGYLRKAYLLLALLFLVFSIIFFLARPAVSQQYSFEVPREEVTVRINKDSSLSVYYRITFRNTSPSVLIDIVDIGMPTHKYLIEKCYAFVNGEPVSDIRPSTVVSPGVEIHLGSKSIKPGEQAVFEFSGLVPEMVFQDTSRQGYASVKFKNTWWSPEYVRGKTYLEFSMQFPPGVKPNETVYHGEARPLFNVSGDTITFTWVYPDASPAQGYLHGVSFPAVYVTGVFPEQPLPEYKPPEPPGTYESELSYQGKTRLAVFFLYLIFLGVAIIVRFFFSMRAVNKRGKKLAYIHPRMAVEGAGPAKGLHPGEFAVLEQQDLDRIAAIAFFQMACDGVVEIIGFKPLRFARKMKSLEGLPPYYVDFAAAIDENGHLSPQMLKSALTLLIKNTEAKVRGFSLSDTVRYYKDIVSEAWVQVKSETDRFQKLSVFRKNLPVLVCDAGFGEKVKEVFSHGEYPIDRSILDMLGKADSPKASRDSMGLEAGTIKGSEFARLVSSAFTALTDGLFPLTEEMENEILKETNPREYRRIIRYRRYYTTGYGGSGCACACACAGCACACAGGGR